MDVQENAEKIILAKLKMLEKQATKFEDQVFAKLKEINILDKENKVLVTTDAIGMGVNLPIRRIIFMSIRKFDGEEVRELTSQEVKQIAGRAGRKGIYDVGYVAGVSDTHNFISRKLEVKDEVINYLYPYLKN